MMPEMPEPNTKVRVKRIGNVGIDSMISTKRISKRSRKPP